MSHFIKAMDLKTNIQIGENGHVENKWSVDYREKIVQFSFQLTRTDKQQMSVLETTFRDMLKNLQSRYSSKQITTPIYEELIITLYKLIAQTRDIIDGKGEYALSYMLLIVWYDFFPNSAKFMLSRFVTFYDDDETQTEHPFGSWKDLKYFANQCQIVNPKHPLIDHCIDLLNNQLRIDEEKHKYGCNELSLVAKWIPREKKQFSWLFELLATDYYKEFLPLDNPTKESAVLKCKTHYRKLLSCLNKVLDTVQIKQCNNNWKDIQPVKQTAITVKRQNRAFLNIDKKGKQRSTSEDRIECANNFKSFVEKAVKGEVVIKGKRLGIEEFVKEAFQLINYRNSQQEQPVDLINMLNSQWINNSTSTKKLRKMIPMVDVSGSMDGNPMFAAIGLGIRIAEKSIIGRRVMTFSAKPSWVNLDGIDNFVDMVACVKEAEWGVNTNFYAALDLILSVIVDMKLPAEEVEDMTLAIFSDMQIDTADKGFMTSNDMFTNIEHKYADAGIKVCGTPYKPPHILFWNLRSTSGFPSLANKANTSMMSGFSPSLLNIFCNDDDLSEMLNPWNVFMQSLSNKRYDIVEDYMKTHIF